MGYALSARGIFAPAQKCRMYQSRSTFPQGSALGYGQHLGLQPAPIIYWAFVQIGSFSTDHLPAELTDFPTNIFSYALPEKPVSSTTIRKIVFIIRKIVFTISKIIFPLI